MEDRTERLSGQIPPQRVLLATDGSDDAALASRAAADICQTTGARLHVAHAWQTLPAAHMRSFVRSGLKQMAQEKLDAEVEKLQSAGISGVEPHLLEGKPAEEVLDLAEEVDAGLIVLGSRGLGPVERLALGSVSEEIIHHATRPVLLLRGGESSWPPERVIFTDDGSDAARAAQELAAHLCGGRGAPGLARGLMVRACPKLPEFDAQEREYDARAADDELRRQEQSLMQRAEELLVEFGERPKVKLKVGDAAAEILEAASQEAPRSTLIVAGSRGLGRIGRMRLGSVSTKLLHAAPGPVLIHPTLPQRP